MVIFTGVTVCSFLDDSVQVYSASRRGHMCVWECNQNTTDLVPKKPGTKKGGSEKEEEDGSAMEENGERIELSILVIGFYLVDGAAMEEKGVTEENLVSRLVRPLLKGIVFLCSML
jgi:hypothetical protein